MTRITPSTEYHANWPIHAKPITGEDVAVVARVIRETYVLFLSIRQGRWRRYKPHPQKERIWTKAAELCLQHGLDPAAHVRLLTETVRDPYPEMLVGQKAAERTTRFMAKPCAHRHERMCLESQLAQLEGRIRVGEDLADVLMLELTSLCPAFRYCMAVRAGLHAVAAKCRYEARLDLLLHPERRRLLDRFMSGAYFDG